MGRKTSLEVRCTHEELAHLVGVHRETVTKILNEFRQQGVIDLGRGNIILHNLVELKLLSEADAP